MEQPQRTGHGNVDARLDAEAIQIEDASDLRARASRIRHRAAELVDVLGPDHPLVARAVNKARILELQAGEVQQIWLE